MTQIIEIIGRADQGVTRPFICRGDDEQIYFVKGRGAGRRSLICEWIAGGLAVALGLPVAPFKVVDVPGSLISLGARSDLGELGEGPAFGSSRMQVTELTLAHLVQIPESAQIDVLAFDWWVKNGDRNLSENGGNPNLFWDMQRNDLVVLDHNQAFDPHFSALMFAELHVFRAYCRKVFGDWVVQEGLARRFEAALAGWDDICDTVPHEWWFVDPEMTIPVDFDRFATLNRLMQCRGDAFWNLR